jgi:hypothetical protein
VWGFLSVSVDHCSQEGYKQDDQRAHSSLRGLVLFRLIDLYRTAIEIGFGDAGLTRLVSEKGFISGSAFGQVCFTVVIGVQQRAEMLASSHQIMFFSQRRSKLP